MTPTTPIPKDVIEKCMAAGTRAVANTPSHLIRSDTFTSAALAEFARLTEIEQFRQRWCRKDMDKWDAEWVARSEAAMAEARRGNDLLAQILESLRGKATGEAVPDNLPRTADSVLVTPGMTVFVIRRPHGMPAWKDKFVVGLYSGSIAHPRDAEKSGAPLVDCCASESARDAAMAPAAPPEPAKRDPFATTGEFGDLLAAYACAWYSGEGAAVECDAVQDYCRRALDAARNTPTTEGR